MDMTSAKIYWRQALLEYNITKPMNLPFDRKYSHDRIQTGQGFSIKIHFKREIFEKLREYTSSSNVTFYHVCLTIYYIFLFKLTGGQRDLIVSTANANRYRPELQNIIGMFVNTLPLRASIDPQDTFEQILRKVSIMIFESHVYSYLPYQSIIEQISMGQSYERNLIQTMFTLNELSITPVQLDHTTSIQPLSISCLDDNTMSIGTPVNTVTMFDIALDLEYIVETHSLQAELFVSTDLFDSDTIVNMAKRFQLLIDLLVSSLSVTNKTTTNRSICELSLILPDEIGQDVDYKHFDFISEFNLTGIIFILNSRQYFCTLCLFSIVAQKHIFIDEQVNSDSQIGINNILVFYQSIKGTISIERLRRALQLVVLQHPILRPSFVFDTSRGCLIQRIVESKNDEEELFYFVKSTFNSDIDLKAIIENELCHHSDFNLLTSHVFRVHIVLYGNNHTDLLQQGDSLIFNFHKSTFDDQFLNVFLRDLRIAYEYVSISPSTNDVIHYTDCKLEIFSYDVSIHL